MATPARVILEELAHVQRLRDERAVDADLAERVNLLKAYQSRRFETTYADLLASDRYRAAARFFLQELYGPQEFVSRDAQFPRVAPKVSRLFPAEITETVAALARLHALSESLDSAMARQLVLPLTQSSYGHAWLAVGRDADRRQQIELTMLVGTALDRYTRSPVLRGALRLMREPARAAGLRELQRFLESGFDTFAAMNGAQHFLDTVRDRERAFIQTVRSGTP